MSEALKKLKEEHEKILKKRTEYRMKSGETPDFSQRSILHELDREAFELEKKIKDTSEKIADNKAKLSQLFRDAINTLDSKSKDEAMDSRTYLNYSKDFEKLPEVARLFKHLSEEEDAHAKQLNYLAIELQKKLAQLHYY